MELEIVLRYFRKFFRRGGNSDAVTNPIKPVVDKATKAAREEVAEAVVGFQEKAAQTADKFVHEIPGEKAKGISAILNSLIQHKQKQIKPQIQEAIPQQAEKTVADITTPTTTKTEGLPQNGENLEKPIPVAEAKLEEQPVTDITTSTTPIQAKEIVPEALPQKVENLEKPIQVAEDKPKEQHVQSGMVYDQMGFLEKDHKLIGGKPRQINNTTVITTPAEWAEVEWPPIFRLHKARIERAQPHIKRLFEVPYPESPISKEMSEKEEEIIEAVKGYPLKESFVLRLLDKAIEGANFTFSHEEDVNHIFKYYKDSSGALATFRYSRYYTAPQDIRLTFAGVEFPDDTAFFADIPGVRDDKKFVSCSYSEPTGNTTYRGKRKLKEYCSLYEVDFDYDRSWVTYYDKYKDCELSLTCNNDTVKKMSIIFNIKDIYKTPAEVETPKKASIKYGDNVINFAIEKPHYANANTHYVKPVVLTSQDISQFNIKPWDVLNILAPFLK